MALSGRLGMLYIKGYLKLIPLVVLGYMHSGQAIPKYCENSFLKKQHLNQIIDTLRSDKSLEDKKQALEFFKKHYVTDLRVHTLLLRLLKSHRSTEELYQDIVNTLRKRKEILQEILLNEFHRVKRLYTRTLIQQIRKALLHILKNDPSVDTRVSLIENENYNDDHEAQKYLVQLLKNSDEKLRTAGDRRLKEILGAYLDQVNSLSIQDIVTSSYGQSLVILLDNAEVYSPSLYKHFSDLLRDSSNSLQTRITAVEFLKVIYSIEFSRLEVMMGVEEPDFSNKDTKQLFKKIRSIEKRTISVMQDIQKTLIDVIQRESEVGHPLIITSIQLLGAIKIFNHEAMVLLEDIRDDESIFNKIRKTAREALNNMDTIREDQYSGAE